MSDRRPSSRPEHLNAGQAPSSLHIDEEGVCDACRQAEAKEAIDWDARLAELEELLDGVDTVLVPGSGGKDSVKAAATLERMGVEVVTCTWPPTLYTDYGWRNYQRWADRWPNIPAERDDATHALLTRLSVENLLHPFQTFILGQKNYAPKVAVEANIPLVFYGENEAEYGNPIADNTTALRDRAYYTYDNLDKLHLGGVPYWELIHGYGLTPDDIAPYLPADPRDIDRVGVEIRYLGYYIRWDPQEAYYEAVEETGFEARPFRTEGTYSKYNSIDDKIDDWHYYTTYCKFGLGRASYDASQEVRNGKITREEAVQLVKRFDGELPMRYASDICDYLHMDWDDFLELCDDAKDASGLFDDTGRLVWEVQP